MKILGITGSIGMGKSTACQLLRQMGVPVHDADATVHRLYGRKGAAVLPISNRFPDVVKDGQVDRVALGRMVFGNKQALRDLEQIVHPLVQAEERAFLARHRRRRTPVVALDIPLLFESRGERRCDAVAVVTAHALIQEQRVLARPGMTEERLRLIRAKQMPDAEKRRRADYIVPSGLGRGVTVRVLRRIVADLTGRKDVCGHQSVFSKGRCRFH